MVCLKKEFKRPMRWRYKLETDYPGFPARMSKDGRIVVPKLTMTLLQNRKVELAGYALNVTLEPF
jgi:ribosomal protein L6P/L9E